jgi:hypothetical protein
MPRGAAAPAAVVPAAANGGGTTGSIAANDLAAQELAERRKLARAAAAWAYENEVGSKAALKNDQFKDRGLTYNMVEPLLKELKAGGTKRRVDAPRDHHCQVLTNDERVKLAEWILACAAGQDPKDRTAVSAKVKEMLRARHASNKRRKWRDGSIRLNDQEVAAVQSREPRLTHTFFQRFYPWCRVGVWAQEGPVQGQGMCYSTQAAPAGLQPSRGCAGRRGGRTVGRVFFVILRRSVYDGRCGFACLVWGTGLVLGVIGVILGWVRLDLMRKKQCQRPLVLWRYVGT